MTGHTSTVNLCRVAPSGYPHHRGFDEICDTLEIAIANLGYAVAVHWNRLPDAGLNIVIGAHLLDPDIADSLGPEIVVYNLEQIDKGARAPDRLRVLQQATVWDYSPRNLDAIRSLTGNPRTTLVPIGYVPELSRIAPAALQTIDVLFYGSTNARRSRMLDRIAARGLLLHRAFGVYGLERDGLIARSKVVVNLHFYESQLFEIVRVSYLLANHKAVVCECDANTEMPADLRSGVRLAAYDDLPDACEELVRDAELRQRYEEAGVARMSRRNACDILREPLAAALAARHAVP